MENNIILNNKEIPYVINYKKIKHIYFRVKDDFKIHISANHKIKESYIRKLLLENEISILKMYDKKKEEKNQELSYLGEKLNLKIKDTKPFIDDKTIYAKDKSEALDYLYSLAKDIFEKRMDAIKIQFDDLPNFKLRVRKMKTKWGVCNTKSMTITLNTKLITKSLHLIDYVIIHELCHFKHMNHSKEYWNYVEKFYPYYKRARKELRY